jgi:DNA invertase Pin-like site-specific DNA recombinase
MEDNKETPYTEAAGEACADAEVNTEIRQEVAQAPAEHHWRPQDADRESIREDIRQRVRNASVPANAVITYPDPTPSIKDEGDKRVAVYARVSTKSTEQVSSIENQTRYYTEKVEKTPNWELQEIYSDEGKSGTSMRKRTEFKRMLQDAADNKMDLILCASVSRFARNIAICTEQLRLLRTQNPSHPVGVYFETENIYTLDPSSSQALSIHAMLADWESAQKSSRMILSYDQRICMGQYPLSDLLGYRHTQDGQLIIQEDEAITVRFIFLAYICGYSLSEIAATLTEKGRKTLKGNTTWDAGMVKAIMQNERRWGDLDVRKRIVIDYIAGTTTKNIKKRVKAFVPEHHEGIVTPQIAKAAHLVSNSNRAHFNGVSDLNVISSGALKGFVSLCPYWGGVDADTFKTVCRSVYSDDEYAALEREARLLNGDDHSNVLSMQLTGYEVPRGVFFMKRTTSTLTISTRDLQFNKTCHVSLGMSQYVEILYHPFLKTLAVRACDADYPNAFQWEDESGNAIMHIVARAFCGSIYDEMMWIQSYRFKFRGVTRKRGNAKMIMFFLDEPQILPGKKALEADIAPTSEEAQSAIKYIPYKRSDKGHVEPMLDADTLYAYPDEWDGGVFGTSYAMRKMRDSIIDSLTESDISIQGTAVLNPMIGEIPTKEQLLEEVERLLTSM